MDHEEEWLKTFDFDLGLDYDNDALDFQPGNASNDNQETGFNDIEKENATFKEERDGHLEEDKDGHPEEDKDGHLEEERDGHLEEEKDGHLEEERDGHLEEEIDEGHPSFGSEEEHIKWSECKDADFLSMRFDSLDDGFTIYNEYAKHTGFSVRKDTLRKTRGDVPISRKFVCSNQGRRRQQHLHSLNRKRSTRPLTRCNCPAFIDLEFAYESKKWVVKRFNANHNHNLAPFPSSALLRSHRNVTCRDGALAQALHGVGIKKSQVMDLMIHKAGGFENVGYTRKDFYNYMDREKREEYQAGDSMSLLGHMDNKSKLDPLFRYKFELDAHKQLIRLFWADMRSCADYTRFGDVLLFDSTYRTNVYRMALVLFAGVNNHHQTVIFGCALMSGETDAAYTWALNALVDTMGGRTPKSVITDGDQAIRICIENVLPSSSHRLCSWHIMQNCLKNIHIPGFAKDFCHLMYYHWTPEQFEDRWEKVVTAYDVGHLNWIQEVYKKRTRWAEAYLHGLFFAGCRSNQRCESLNSMIRHYVSPTLKISQLYQKIEWAIERIRHCTHQEEVRTLMTEPSIDSHLPAYEKYAASIYTRSSYYVFKRQLEMEALYSLVDTKLHDQNCKIFTVRRYLKRETQYFVDYNVDLNTIKCSCALFESYGFPCRHIISALKHEDVEQIPNTCILKRWTRLAKEGISTMGGATVDVKIQSAIRYSELMEECNQVCLVGCRSDKDFEHVKSSIARITNSVMHPSTHCVYKNTTPKKTPTHSPSKGGEHIHEPPLVASKGRPSVKRQTSFIEGNNKKKCSLCKTLGHTRPTCPKLHSETNGEDVGTSNQGFAKRQKKCGHCQILGHTRPTCPSLHFEANGENVGTSNQGFVKKPAKVIDVEAIYSNDDVILSRDVVDSDDSDDSDEVIYESASRNNIDYTSISQPIFDGYCDPVLGHRFSFA